MHVDTASLRRRRQADSSTWIVPGLGLNDANAISARLNSTDARHAINAVASHAAGGGRVAASCSAVFLLQAAGLLPGRRVTTTWWLAPLLRSLEPDSNVDADKMICVDGQVTTAGAALAQVDLMLHLLRVGFSASLASAVGKVLLIDGSRAQADYIVPAMLSTGSELIERLMKRVESALPNVMSVEFLAEEFAMSSRTLSRHVRHATGKSTVALIQGVRLNRARMLIETSRMTIDRIAEQVGYGDATALRRLMQRVSGTNPSRYRASKLAS